ncbi:MAG: hypothetical protein ACYDHY_06610 [Acidiferrobacterales bacterium]
MCDGLSAAEFDRINASHEYTVPCTKSVIFSAQESDHLPGNSGGKVHPSPGAYVNKHQGELLECLKKHDLIKSFQETEDGNFIVSLKEPAMWIDLKSPCPPSDIIVRDLDARAQQNGKEARVCVCGEAGCEPITLEHSSHYLTDQSLGQNLKRMVENMNRHTHPTGPGPSEPPRTIVWGSISAMVETSVPRTGKLQEVEESFAMNVYEFWVNACSTDQVMEEDPPRWKELPNAIKENFVQAMRTQCLMPIQSYINSLTQDKDMAVNLLSKKVQSTIKDSGVAAKGWCYVCSRNPATNGRLCGSCQRTFQKS